MKACSAVIRGHVQGVGFRYSAQQLADELGITGWVRNRPDGSVGVWIQGPADSIGQLMAFLHRGPLGASVTSVEAQEADPDPTLTAFEIRF